MADRRVVLPGDRISDKKLYLPNTFIEGEETYAAVIGLLDEEGRYIPLESRYKPVLDDVLVGVVTDIRHAGYSVDVNMSLPAFISAKDFRVELNLGDIVSCKVGQVYEVGDVEFAEVKKLQAGKVICFPPAKVPRLIGRKSSMINLIREHSGGDIVVGNNGYVWISEINNIPLVLKSINMIIQKAHTSGLTDEIAQFLKRQKEGEGPHG